MINDKLHKLWQLLLKENICNLRLFIKKKESYVILNLHFQLLQIIGHLVKLLFDIKIILPYIEDIHTIHTSADQHAFDSFKAIWFKKCMTFLRRTKSFQ